MKMEKIMGVDREPRIAHYELLFIVSNKFTEEEAKKVVDKIEKIVEAVKGEVNYREYWGKKRLAYPIGQFTYGYYALCEFNLETQNLAELERRLRLSKDILRHLVVSRKFRTAEEIAAEKKMMDELAEKFKKEKEEKNSRHEEEVKKEVESEIVSEENAPVADDKKEEVGDKKTKKTPVKEKKDDRVELKDLDEKLDKILEASDLL